MPCCKEFSWGGASHLIPSKQRLSPPSPPPSARRGGGVASRLMAWRRVRETCALWGAEERGRWVGDGVDPNRRCLVHDVCDLAPVMPSGVLEGQSPPLPTQSNPERWPA